jgi:hypothetical protein
MADAGRMVDLVWQPEMGGTMQHYGFPTDFLDVTPDPGVALWFALHGTRQAGGYTEFQRTAWSSADADDQWPVVYVFNAFRRHVVDLRDGCLSQATALRIHRQHASLLTTVEFVLPIMNPNMPRRLAAAIPPQVTEVRPNLVLVLKLQPDESWKRSASEASAWYFPQDDEIYRALVDGDAPHVARYSV